MVIKNLPSYLYQQYNDDPNILAFFDSYNTSSQSNLDRINNLNLPNYTTKFGLMLDWVSEGIYGIKRPVLPFLGTVAGGVFNEAIYDTAIYNENIVITPSGTYQTTDDLFKRIITWNFYKGDGYYFNITWLKNRVYRFLAQANGIPASIPNTYEISVTFGLSNAIDITIASSDLTALAPILEAGINSGALQVPFQYNFNIIY